VIGLRERWRRWSDRDLAHIRDAFDFLRTDYGFTESGGPRISEYAEEWLNMLAGVRRAGRRRSSTAATGWRVHDRGRDHLYTFGTYTLGAGKTVTIHTGNGSNTARNRYWRLDNYVWNNDGDKATLKKPNGTIIDTCSYSGAGSAVAC
jgi:hypothetical protein